MKNKVVTEKFQSKIRVKIRLNRKLCKHYTFVFVHIDLQCSAKRPATIIFYICFDTCRTAIPSSRLFRNCQRMNVPGGSGVGALDLDLHNHNCCHSRWPRPKIEAVIQESGMSEGGRPASEEVRSSKKK